PELWPKINCNFIRWILCPGKLLNLHNDAYPDVYLLEIRIGNRFVHVVPISILCQMLHSAEFYSIYGICRGWHRLCNNGITRGDDYLVANWNLDENRRFD